MGDVIVIVIAAITIGVLNYILYTKYQEEVNSCNLKFLVVHEELRNLKNMMTTNKDIEQNKIRCEPSVKPQGNVIDLPGFSIKDGNFVVTKKKNKPKKSTKKSPQTRVLMPDEKNSNLVMGNSQTEDVKKQSRKKPGPKPKNINE